MTIPPHGTQHRYKGPRNGQWEPCRCPACTRAQRHACTRRALAHAAGTPPMHPAAPVIQHITTCTTAGMSYLLIARTAGVAAATIKHWARRTDGALRRETALRILAVQPGRFDASADRPSHGAVRRIRALYTLGHSPAAIAAVAGLDTSTVSHFANGRYNIASGRTHAAIASVYRQLITTTGTSRKAVAVAARHGWHGPLDWDDIDDPTATPERDGRPTRGSRSAGLVADWEELAARGLTRQQVADRLGVSRHVLDQAITRQRRLTRTDMETAA